MRHTAPSNRKYDFDTVPVMQLKFTVPAAWNDFAIDLDCDAPVTQAHVAQQGGERHRRLETLFLTIEQDLHELGKISSNRKSGASSAVIVIPVLK